MVSSLFFNSSTKVLHFNLADPSEVTGYSDVFIPKNIVGNIQAEVICDGKTVEHDIISIEDSWIIHFSNINDVNEVVITLTGASTRFNLSNEDLLPILLVLSVIVLCGILIYFSRRKR